MRGKSIWTMAWTSKCQRVVKINSWSSLASKMLDVQSFQSCVLETYRFLCVLIGFPQQVIPLPAQILSWFRYCFTFPAAKGILPSKTHGEFHRRSFALAAYQHALCKLWTQWKPSGLCDEPTVINLSSHLPGHQGAKNWPNWRYLDVPISISNLFLIHWFHCLCKTLANGPSLVGHFFFRIFSIFLHHSLLKLLVCHSRPNCMGSRSGTTNTATMRWAASVSMASARIAWRWKGEMVRSSMSSGDHRHWWAFPFHIWWYTGIIILYIV